MSRRYTTYKTVVILQLVKLGYVFRPLPGHHQANKEIMLIKVHSLACCVTAHYNKLVIRTQRDGIIQIKGQSSTLYPQLQEIEN